MARRKSNKKPKPTPVTSDEIDFHRFVESKVEIGVDDQSEDDADLQTDNAQPPQEDASDAQDNAEQTDLEAEENSPTTEEDESEGALAGILDDEDDNSELDDRIENYEAAQSEHEENDRAEDESGPAAPSGLTGPGASQEDSGDNRQGQVGGTGDTDADRKFREKMAEIHQDAKVAVFGFKSSGKTWLLHRLRRHLVNKTDAELDPPFKELPQHGMALEGTSDFEVHEIIVPKKGMSWSMIDSPGEYSKLLIGGNVEDMWQMVHVLSKASAIIITIPSDVLVFGAQMEEADIHSREECEAFATEICGSSENSTDIQDLTDFLVNLVTDFADLRNFAYGLYRAAATLSYVKEEGIDALDPEAYSRVTWSRVKEHIKHSEDFKPVGGLNGLTCPTFISLTKADRLVSVLYGENDIPDVGTIINRRKNEMLEWPQTRALRELAERGGLIDDSETFPLSKPSQFVRALEDNLHSRIVRYFPMSRFDFVSAFFGHDYSTTLKFGHYKRHPDFGVPDMHDWIRRALALSKKGDKRISRQAFARQIHFAIHGIPQPGTGAVEGTTK